MDKAYQLETIIEEMTRPINGQYPRPWMTTSTDPASSVVFTVGRNQRHGFPVGAVNSHAYYIDTLFNRGPETCRQLYDRLTEKSSPTRRNTDDLVRRLAAHKITSVLQTNVICYSTPMSADLRQSRHSGGGERGRALFQTLLDIIKPRVLIVHGGGAANELAIVLGACLPSPPHEPSELVEVEIGEIKVFVIPSLAPPAYNRWARWAAEHLDQVSRRVAEHLTNWSQDHPG